MQEKIKALIEETEDWREQHRRMGRQLEAMACAVRVDAFKDVLKIIQENK